MPDTSSATPKCVAAHPATAQFRMLLRARLGTWRIPPDVADRLVEHAALTSTVDAAEIASSDKDAGFVHFLVVGAVKAICSATSVAKAKPLTAFYVPPGRFLCLPPSRGMPWRAAFVAHEPSIVAVISKAHLAEVLTQQGAERLLRLAVVSWRQVARRLFDRLAFSRLLLRERVLHEVAAMARDFGRIQGDWVHVGLLLTHEEIGELVGGSRASVTRALGRFRAQNLIARAGRRLLVAKHLLLGSRTPPAPTH